MFDNLLIHLMFTLISCDSGQSGQRDCYFGKQSVFHDFPIMINPIAYWKIIFKIIMQFSLIAIYKT